MRRLRFWWRQLRGRCAICGAKRAWFTETDIHTRGPYCRRCNKVVAFGALYGSSKTQMAFDLDNRRVRIWD